MLTKYEIMLINSFRADGQISAKDAEQIIETALALYDKLEKAEAELAEFKDDVALLLDQKDDYQEKLFEENEALKAEIEGLKKIIAAANSTASMAHYGGYIRGYIK